MASSLIESKQVNNGIIICADTYTKYISKIMQEFQINLTVAGGVSSDSDINSLNELGVNGVIIGKAFYENYLNPTIINKYS